MHLKITHRNNFKKLKEVRDAYLRAILRHTKGDTKEAAELSGLSERTLRDFKKEMK